LSFVVGLTGGIGSGKSAAADEFARLGAAVIDTDAISRELTAAGGAAIPHIRRMFGDAFVEPGGAMDRAKMRERVFADPAARKSLEALLHPLFRAETLRRTAAAAGPYVVQVVPLLVESPDYGRRVNRVLVIDVPEALQIERVRARGLAEQQVRGIIASQASREARLAAADDVIDNTGTVDALHKAVRGLHSRYVELAKGVKG
jgi:dephospho-CoA kinase